MAHTTQQLPVLIVGGGIGGLAAALALARKGCRVRLIEQAFESMQWLYGEHYGPTGYGRALERAGVAAH